MSSVGCLSNFDLMVSLLRKSQSAQQNAAKITQMSLRCWSEKTLQGSTKLCEIRWATYHAPCKFGKKAYEENMGVVLHNPA